MEIWKDIDDYENLYQVSNLSRVRSLDRSIFLVTKTRIFKGRIIKCSKGNKIRYNTVSLWKDNIGKTYKIANLVGIAFIPNPDNYKIINHKDGNKANDNISNLEWCTQSQNMQHAVDTGLWKCAKGEDAALSKLTNIEVLEIRRRLNGKERTSILAEYYKMSWGSINDIKLRKTWKHI